MPAHPGATGRKSGQADTVYDPVFTEPETAEYIGVSIFTLRRWRKAGKVPYVQLSDRLIGYRQSQRDAILKARTVEPTNNAA
jgi:hypothetical protein